MSLAIKIAAIDGCLFSREQDLTTYTTMKLASRGDVVEVKSSKALQRLLPLLKSYRRKYLVVGWGANQILPPVCQDLIIHLNFNLDQTPLQSLQSSYLLPASIGLNQLTAMAIRFGLKGWEVFTGIPASLGGAVYMNAGTNLGEIGHLVSKVILVTADGQIRAETISEKSFSYRKNNFVLSGEVIVEVELTHFGSDQLIAPTIKQYLEYRKMSQPLTTKNCGCVFKNPMKEAPAGKLIDLIGLKGLLLGGLKISEKHANFVENQGASDWNEFRSLIELIKFQMDHFYGIEFELEVKIPYH